MIFNTSARRSAALKRQDGIEKNIASLSSIDLMIYWIGDVPEELGSLKKNMTVLKPEEISKDNMPVKASTFHITVRDDSGRTEEVLPRHYSEYMIIVINTGSGFDDNAKEVIRNCIVDNGVPVVCIGGDACNMFGALMIHGAGFSKDYSLFYKVKEGYKEPYLDPKSVTSSTMELAEDLSGKLSAYFIDASTRKQADISERISSAVSSSEEAATATTESSESTENSSSETREKILIKP